MDEPACPGCRELLQRVAELEAGIAELTRKLDDALRVDELRECRAPEPVGRWHPVAYATVLDAVKETLHGAGYTVRAEKYALARHDARFFGVLDLETPLAAGVALSVGVRSSVDKSFPLGFAAGSRVFVCDNLAFRS